MAKKKLTKAKAKKILRDGVDRAGNPLTAKARRFLGARAGGVPIKPKRKVSKKRKTMRKK